MQYSAVLVTVFAVLACAQARVAREVPASGQPTLNDLIAQAQAGLTSVGEQIQKSLNISSQDSVFDTIKRTSTTFATNVQNYITEASKHIQDKSPEVQKLFNDAKAGLEKAISDINAQIPNGKEQVAKLQTAFQDGIQELVKASDTAAKNFSQNSGKIQEDFAKISREALNLAVETTQTLNTQLQQVAPKKQ